MLTRCHQGIFKAHSHSPLLDCDGVDVSDGKNWVCVLTVWGVIGPGLSSISAWFLFWRNPKSLVVSLMNLWKRLSWLHLDLGWKLSTLRLLCALSSWAKLGDRDMVGRLLPFLLGLFPGSSLISLSFLPYLLLIFSLMIAFLGFGGTTGLLSHGLDLTLLTIWSTDNCLHSFPNSNWLLRFEGGDWNDFECLILPLGCVDCSSWWQFAL